MGGHHLAQVNVGRLVAPIDDPIVADFVDQLDAINALADASPGFVWRLQTEDGDATGIRVDEDPQQIVNMSVWRSLEELHTYAYRSAHVEVLRRRRDWFDPHTQAHQALWWLPVAELPSVEQGLERLAHLRANGPTPYAFTFKAAFDAAGARPGQ